MADLRFFTVSAKTTRSCKYLMYELVSLGVRTTFARKLG